MSCVLLFVSFCFPFLTSSLPDLIVDETSLENSSYIETRWFPENHCEVIEGCVGGSGMRTLFRFDGVVANIGTSPMHFGNPKDIPDIFEYHDCHDHYHFNNWVLYTVLDPIDLSFVHDGGKQGFCLEDGGRYGNYPHNKSLVNRTGTYNCRNQGLSVGWYDRYAAEISCQYIDITDLEPGLYILEAHVNPYEIVEESDYDNNKVYVTFEWDGDTGLSDYKPTKRDLRKFKRKVNKLNNNDQLLEIFEQFCVEFDFLDLCISRNESRVDYVISLIWQIFNLDEVSFQTFPYKKTFNPQNGYFTVEGITRYINGINCTLIQDTYSIVYFDDDGIMDEYNIIQFNQGLDALFINFTTNNATCEHDDIWDPKTGRSSGRSSITSSRTSKTSRKRRDTTTSGESTTSGDHDSGRDRGDRSRGKSGGKSKGRDREREDRDSKRRRKRREAYEEINKWFGA